MPRSRFSLQRRGSRPRDSHPTSVDCGICGWSGESYLPRFGSTGRLCVCPQCRSLDRNRHLNDVLAATCPLGSDTTVLDVAPSIALLRKLADSTIYVGVDYDPSSPLVLHADLRRLPFADQSFDVVLCSHVLEHIRDDASAISELRRVLRVGGTAFVQVPYFARAATEELHEVDKHGHVRNYARADLLDRLAEGGFVVQPVSLHDGVRSDQHRYDAYDVFVCRADDRPALPAVSSYLADVNRLAYRSGSEARDASRHGDIAHRPMAT